MIYCQNISRMMNPIFLIFKGINMRMLPVNHPIIHANYSRTMFMSLLVLIVVCFFSKGVFALDFKDEDQIRVSTPPPELDLDPFYKKYVDAGGFPVISSYLVPDEALLQARRQILAMTAELPRHVIDTMQAYGVRLGIMAARYEGTTDIPEHNFLKNDTINWDVRARGLGGTPRLPLTTASEENILCYQIDKYHAEDILIHEFAHTIHLVGLVLNYPDFNDRLRELLDDARSKGLWKDTYAETNIEEYWAEGVQTWFNVNATVPEPDGLHNHIGTRDQLRDYDPGLYELLKEFFPDTDECISCHCE